MEWMKGKEVEQRTDDNLDDEAAGIARIEMAKQSKARRAREAAELKKRNKDMKARIAANRKTQRTDDDLDDEEAGKMRAVMAQQSKDRRAKEADTLSSKNQAVFLSIRNQGTRSDDDIMDEDAGRARLIMRAASLEFKAAESDDLKKKNKEARMRLKKMKPKVITSQAGAELYRQPGWVVATVFDSKFAQYPTRRSPGDAKPPSWLKKTEKYDWAAPLQV